jgi:two-component system cell cycle sensor histidine kinase/response regulator CckA
MSGKTLPPPVFLSQHSGNSVSEIATCLATARLVGFSRIAAKSEFGLSCRLLRSGDFLWRLEPQSASDSASGADFPTEISDSTIETLPVALLRITPLGGILHANDEARVLLGLNHHENARLSQIVEGLGRPINDWIADCVASDGALQAESLQSTKGICKKHLRIVIRKVRRNIDTHIFVIIQDATEYKSLEVQFVQSQKMQAVGQLAGGIAHDFNNLLTAIGGHCDLLLLRHDETDADFADLEQIQQNANRAAGMVGQLLAFSRKQNLQPVVIDLNVVLGDLTHLLNRLLGEKISLNINAIAETALVKADKRQLEQVIVNIVVNARDAMPLGGVVKVEIDQIQIKQTVKRGRVSVPAGKYVTVKISDRGDGIEPETLEKIFEPFFTTKSASKGTGLGLSTVCGIVKQSGGYIFVESDVQVGTTFNLYLPAEKSQMIPDNSAEKVQESLPVVSTGQRILVVEDEPAVRSFAMRALSMRGFKVTEACSGEEALSIVNTQGLVPDLIVSDVVMPGMDGPTWVKAALKSHPDLKVVFVSGYAAETFVDGQRQIPGSVFLQKPYSLRQLTEVVGSQLNLV